MIRKKAFDNRYFGFKSSTANNAKAIIKVNIPNPRKNIGKYNISYVLPGEIPKYKIAKNMTKHPIPPAIKNRKRQRCQRNHQKQMKAPAKYPGSK